MFGISCCTSINLIRCHTYICFEEYQLALDQIGISPLSRTHRRIMQHSPVRSFIIWSWKDHLASGLIELTYPRLLLKKIITISSFHLKFKEVKTKRNYPKLSLFLNLIKLFYFIFKSPVAFAKAIYLASPINLLTHYAKVTPSS